MKSNKKKICVVTGTRAEYGLLYWLLKKIKENNSTELQLVVTGAHLSKDFGFTKNEILKDGFKISREIDIILSSDSASSITKSLGLAFLGFADALKELKPDIMILLGDRYELLAAAYSATIANIPIAHFHGGELSEGSSDEPTRHSITKMSHIHFVSTPQYKKRVIQLGENPKSVFMIGAMGIENINKLNLLTKIYFEKSINFKLAKKNILITYHPVTFEGMTTKNQFNNLLKALSSFRDINYIFTMPNADKDGRIIIDLIKKFVQKFSNKSVYIYNMGQVRYLSAFKYIDAVVGNSSSGIIEAPSFKIATINIGERQRGRIRAKSVIDCDYNEKSIIKSIKKVFSSDFKKKLKKIINPYDGNTSQKSFDVIKKINLKNIMKKNFYDI